MMKTEECFKIQVMEAKNVFDLKNGTAIKKIVNSQGFRLEEPTTIVADPFLFVEEGILYLFYENKKMYHDGVISMISTKDLQKWTAPRVVLREKCHLSYPYVFKDQNKIYMIPETCSLNSIRIYEAVGGDLKQFRYVHTLLMDGDVLETGFSYSDSSIYKKDGIYYLMTTVNDGTKNILKLFYSDRLFEGYKEHPCSPVYSNNKFGRCAGSMFKHKKTLYRVAQDCENGYGNNVHLFRVDQMTICDYQETLIYENMIPVEVPFYKNGGHQFNTVEFKGKNIIATDAKEYKFYAINRILHKLGMYKNGAGVE